MPKLDYSIPINAPIDTCYSLCKSFDHLVAFMRQSQSGVELEIKPQGEGIEFQKGETYSVKSMGPPFKVQMLVRVEEDSPPYLLVLSGEQTLQSSYTLRYELSAVGDQTNLKISYFFKPAKGLLGMMLSPIAASLQRVALGLWGSFLRDAAESISFQGGSLSGESRFGDHRNHNQASEQNSKLSTAIDYPGAIQPSRTEGVSPLAVVVAIILIASLAYYYL